MRCLTVLAYGLLVLAGALKGADEGSRELLLGLLVAGGAVLLCAGALRRREMASADPTKARSR